LTSGNVEPVGDVSPDTPCGAYNERGDPCMHPPRANGLCWLHQDRADWPKKLKLNAAHCGARTAKGTPCAKPSSENGRCYLHAGMKQMEDPSPVIEKEPRLSNQLGLWPPDWNNVVKETRSAIAGMVIAIYGVVVFCFVALLFAIAVFYVAKFFLWCVQAGLIMLMLAST
jgi:hypothetical protein